MMSSGWRRSMTIEAALRRRERDMAEIERLVIVGGLERDARAVDKVDHRHQHTVGENRMGGGEDQIMHRRIGAERPGLDPHGARRPA